MRRAMQLILAILPMLLLSQDSTATKEVKFITIPTVGIEYQRVPQAEVIKFECTEDIKQYVTDFLTFMDKYGLDATHLANYDGMYTCNNMDKYGSSLTIGLTFKGVPEANVKSLTLLRAGSLGTPLKTKAVVFHELTHVLTNNVMPHCSDAVNCSVLFYKDYGAIVNTRLELFWDLEEEQLANMIKIYEKFDKKYGKK